MGNYDLKTSNSKYRHLEGGGNYVPLKFLGIFVGLGDYKASGVSESSLGSALLSPFYIVRYTHRDPQHRKIKPFYYSGFCLNMLNRTLASGKWFEAKNPCSSCLDGAATKEMRGSIPVLENVRLSYLCQLLSKEGIKRWEDYTVCLTS